MFENFVGNPMKRWKLLMVIFALVIVGWLCISYFSVSESTSEANGLEFLEAFHRGGKQEGEVLLEMEKFSRHEIGIFKKF